MNINFDAGQRVIGRYINMDHVADTIVTSVIGSNRNPLRRNIVFYGPGGYGKSEFVYDYLSAITDTVPFVMSMHKETTTSELFGGIDIPAMQKGKLRYRVDDSFMNHEYVILEEGFDAPDTVLMSLKDVMTRRQFTNGDYGDGDGGRQLYQVKTKLIIVNTNHSPDRFMSDPAKKAFIDRFSYIKRVDWTHVDAHTTQTSYLWLVYEEVDKTPDVLWDRNALDFIIELVSTESWSPRKTIQLIQSVIDSRLYRQKLVDCGRLRSIAPRISREDVVEVCEQIGIGKSDMVAKLKDAIARQEIKDAVRSAKVRIREVYDAVERDRRSINKLKKSIRPLMKQLNDIRNTLDRLEQEYGKISIDEIHDARTEIEDARNFIHNQWMAQIDPSSNRLEDDDEE